ncbi:MAG: phosphoribosylformylglycinamidine synthase subunit PurQ, partial [Candidatus Electryoneaceae bacterium]|nr:phosphoribosylformylglycinamidine synthase subunit PurQ [Candidatus Electryoneaceae bacterium]
MTIKTIEKKIGQEHLTRWGVVIFPGSNCDHDAIDVVGRICGQEVVPMWHQDGSIGGSVSAVKPPYLTATYKPDAIILPGGFSYGDYLRSGAIARFANAMDYVVRFAERDGLVIGICNGFQVLTEAGLVPGVLLRNVGLRFVCRRIYIRVERTDTPFTSHLCEGQVLRLPIAHNEGNFYLPQDQLDELEKNRQVIFRYCDRDGNVTPEANPNGSINNIAGIINQNGNVLGMMP